MSESWFTKNARREGKYVRLARLMSQRGLASRRVAAEWIRKGRVRVNGRTLRSPQLGVHPELDKITVDDEPGGPAVLPAIVPAKRPSSKLVSAPPDGVEAPPSAPPVWWMLHKPVGCLTTARDPEGRKTVYDFLPKGLSWMAPVGRLDFDTSGLLLFTNETAVAAALRDPDRGIPKVYEISVHGDFPANRLRDFYREIPLGRGEVARPAKARLLGRAREGSRLELTLTEGKNREVRRMLKTLGYEVVRLHRVAFGPIRLEKLAEGEARPLEAGEVGKIRETAIR